ncbi:HlyD family secretion protein [Bradyrhizobium sp. 4]|uniref:HlyD family secretion protein n=1 Tax=unclassified Bradyrhizobium TaxID=2631580 RepID=UPI001FFC046F|nr:MULTISPECIES: HlyD family secretion protein [unclassified Bradyrhizobium]MCK1397070.1 HlyD family secretion protein [Bradyrhizobium sp. 39]MCK1752892.1 HlyD family secretion protein [Bradyrhizobium sp. 135]UPJ37088.1 HlyD family secretion protein [Bradyrhizobium sp. 4]
MIIILCLYVLAMWVIFSKLKLVRWGWLSGTISILIGAFILATFLALFNHLTPSGKVTVAGRVIEVTPNVTGQVIAIPVKPNIAVKSGDVLFQLDPAPFQYKVTQLQASLAAAKQQTQILKANYDQASANVAGLDAQYKYNAKRLQDIQTLYASGSNTEFKEQDTQVQFETVGAQLKVAKATQESAKLALDSEIGGVNPTVAQLQAQLESATWELAQTTVRAPADGFATAVALTVGDRAFQLRSAMSFIVENEITIVGMFAQNGFQTIKAGTPVNIVFDNDPGRIYHAKITEIPKGIGQGQIAASGTLARTNAIGGASGFPAVISIPDELSGGSLRLGMSGNATAFAPNAGVIGMLASILVWVSSYTAYL